MEFSTEFVERVTELFAEELEGVLADQPDLRINDVESTLRQMLVQIGAACLGAYLSGQDPRYPARTTPCSCGNKASYYFRRSAKVVSVFGRVTYRRAYYVCSTCSQGHYPLDEKLGVEPGQVTAGLASLLGIAGVETSFEKASQLVQRFLLVEVSENTVRKETQHLGQLQAQREAIWIQESQDTEVYRERHRTAPERPKRIYGSLDGAHVPMEGEWRELKIGCWYEVEALPAKRITAGRRARVGEVEALRAKNITYYADMLPADRFGDLLWATGCQRDADLAEEIVFVADAAAWIWKLISTYFPSAVQIVDWYHAVEYLKELAQQALDDDQPAHKVWLEEVKKELWEGRVDAVLYACRQWQDHPQAGKAAKEAITYYTNNRERLDYARFRQAGYMIGSGTVESGCKQIVSQRLKRSGARWTEEGAVATAKARSAWLSNQWDQVSSMRSDRPLVA